MQKWSTGLIGEAIVLVMIGSCALLFWWQPPTEVEMQNHYTRWEHATETGDWETVWGMLSLPMPYGRSEEGPHPPLPDLATFERERQRYGAGLQREVERITFKRLTHNDDPYTYIIMVDIDYFDSEAHAVVKTERVRFYLTCREGQMGIWGFSTNKW